MSLFLGNIGQENVFQNILQGKNAFLAHKKKDVQKVQKLRFFQRVNPWFWSKSGHFSMSFFKAIQARKICFTLFQNKKTSFQPIKKRSSKSRKIEIFPKGLTHGFGQKTAIFPCLSFFCNIGKENVIYNIPEKKTPFQPIKKISSKRRKIEIFPRG